MAQTLSVTPMLLCSSLSFSELHGVAVAGVSGSGTGVRSGVAVGSGVGGTPGVGGGGCGAKIPYGSRSRRYISQCSVMFRAGSAVKHTHAHLSGKQRSRCCGFAASTAGVQAAASFSASVIVLPSQSQQPSMPVTGPGVGLGGSVNGSYEAASG